MKFQTKILILIVVVGLFLITSVVALQEIVLTQQEIGLTISTNIPLAIPQNQTRSWNIYVLNSSTIIDTGATCYLYIYDEDYTGDNLYENSSSTFTGHEIIFNVPANVHENKGIYSYKVGCNTSTETGLIQKTYYVTKNGNEPAEDFFKLFIYLIFMFAIVGLLYTLLIGLAKLVTASTTVYDVAISWAFYILLIITYFLAQNFLINIFIENLSSFFLTVTAWTNGVLPVLSFIFSVIKKGFDKKRPPSVRDIGGKLGYG